MRIPLNTLHQLLVTLLQPPPFRLQLFSEPFFLNFLGHQKLGRVQKDLGFGSCTTLRTSSEIILVGSVLRLVVIGDKVVLFKRQRGELIPRLVCAAIQPPAYAANRLGLRSRYLIGPLALPHIRPSCSVASSSAAASTAPMSREYFSALVMSSEAASALGPLSPLTFALLKHRLARSILSSLQKDRDWALPLIPIRLRCARIELTTGDVAMQLRCQLGRRVRT